MLINLHKFLIIPRVTGPHYIKMARVQRVKSVHFSFSEMTTSNTAKRATKGRHLIILLVKVDFTLSENRFGIHKGKILATLGGK
jgi:hypothetical protein